MQTIKFSLDETGGRVISEGIIQDVRKSTEINMAEERLIPLSRIRPEQEMDSVVASKQFGNRRAFSILMEAQQYWSNMSRFRRDRERNKRYAYGEQWKDIVVVDGNEMTEEEYLLIYIQKQRFLLQKLYILNYMLVENLVEIADIKYQEVFMELELLLLMHFLNGQKLLFKEMVEYSK